jgi:hypothetical protein
MAWRGNHNRIDAITIASTAIVMGNGAESHVIAVMWHERWGPVVSHVAITV